MKIENVLAWCLNAERAVQSSIENAGGGYVGDAMRLREAIDIIRRQHDEIQKARNDLIDATATEKDDLK